jgi:hypothetical protein
LVGRLANAMPVGLKLKRKTQKLFKLPEYNLDVKEEIAMAMMNGYGMMGSSSIGMSLWWIIQIAIVAFVFGIVFWWTKKIIFKK